MEYFIYKIVNHDTNKIYYGNTCRSIYLRLKEHKNSYLNMLSNNQVYHVKDDIKNWKHSNDRDYNTINDKISEIF